MTSVPDLDTLRIPREARAPVDGRGGRRWVRVAVPVAVVAALAAVVTLVIGGRRATPVQTAVVTTTGGTLGAGGSISANGYVVARTKASVAAKIPGRLEYLGVSEGSYVRRGQVIARLESADYQAALLSARARAGQTAVQLADARRKLARAEALAKQKLLSDVELENAATAVQSLDAALRTARAEEALARANLANTLVRAPFTGTVLRKDAEVGEIVSPSAGGGAGLTRTAIVTMADLATLEVEVDVNEAYIAQVRSGEAASITLDAYPDTSFRGTVRQVVPTADRQKATVQVKVAILDHDPRILPEMGAKVEFAAPAAGGASVAAAPQRVFVPPAAIVRDGGETRVWIIEKGRAKAHAVTLGPERGDHVEVRSGLSGGETVIVAPPDKLRDGARVRAASGGATASP